MTGNMRGSAKTVVEVVVILDSHARVDRALRDQVELYLLEVSLQTNWLTPGQIDFQGELHIGERAVHDTHVRIGQVTTKAGSSAGAEDAGLPERARSFICLLIPVARKSISDLFLEI